MGLLSWICMCSDVVIMSFKPDKPFKGTVSPKNLVRDRPKDVFTRG
jgi:hypothetical protein